MTHIIMYDGKKKFNDLKFSIMIIIVLLLL